MGQKVCILAGIFSGNHTTRKLRGMLEKAGYEITASTTEADIILAHSAGCLWVPKLAPHQRLFLVNPPYWPGVTIRERGRARSHSNLKFREYGYPLSIWVARQLWGIYYAITDYRRTRHILRHMPRYNLEVAIRRGEVILVRNKHDDWLTPELTDLQANNPKLKVIHMPGDHDDFNYNPAAYVHLLQSEHKE